ncbi:MAG: adenylosuccinate lyase [Bacillota bacterium]|nr:MAG: adenylosuccinate lyase [Bacillota bacterium]
MIKRYQTDKLRRLWSDQHKFKSFLKVELSASKAWLALGLFDEVTYHKLSLASFELKDIERYEKETKHDVIAFTKACTKNLGEEKKWFHYGLTSTDIVDTAQSLVLKDVNKIIKNDLINFMDVLKEKAYQYQSLPCIGRTHGMHAEITSFGLKFALWYDDFKRIYRQFIDAAKNIEVAKLSGAVGNYSANTPELQELVAKDLKLGSANISTQTLQRDLHASYLSSLALIGAELEKIAVEIRHLSRTEIGEVSEFFDLNQKGSSAMPHKRNPISSENITGLSRVLRGYMLSAYENIPLWHERDISHSSVERIILQDATSLVNYMLERYTDTIKHLSVHEKRVVENIDLTHGVIHTQSVLNLLINHHVDREQAYQHIQKLAFTALDEKKSFLKLLKSDSLIQSTVSDNELDTIFNPQRYLKFVNEIYLKVFK